MASHCSHRGRTYKPADGEVRQAPEVQDGVVLRRKGCQEQLLVVIDKAGSVTIDKYAYWVRFDQMSPYDRGALG